MMKPPSIRIEASSACQLKCPSCPTGQGLLKTSVGSGFLKFKDFQNLIDKNSWVKDIELSNWGEIFLNPGLIQIMQYAHEKGVRLTANNGVNFNTASDEVLEGLVKYQFASLNCSIDGASADTYAIYRRQGSFENVIANIKKVNLYKAKYNSPYPQLRWQFVVFGHNEHEIAAASAMAAALDMAFYVKLSWDEDFSQ